MENTESCPHLTNQAVPRPIDLLAVLAVGDQVEVVGEPDGAGQLLQDVDAEAFAAQLGVRLGVTHNAEGRREKVHSLLWRINLFILGPHGYK